MRVRRCAGARFSSEFRLAYHALEAMCGLPHLLLRAALILAAGDFFYGGRFRRRRLKKNRPFRCRRFVVVVFVRFL